MVTVAGGGMNRCKKVKENEPICAETIIMTVDKKGKYRRVRDVCILLVM